VLPVGPVAVTTLVEEDVDGGALGVLLVGSTVATTLVEEDVDGRTLRGATGGSGSGHHLG
jgi:hypothetical protein